jgi:hypothetical protein
MMAECGFSDVGDATGTSASICGFFFIIYN